MFYLVLFVFLSFKLVIFVEFEQSSYLVNEKAGYIEICLLSDGQNSNAAFVDVQPHERVPISASGMLYINAYIGS